MAEGVRENKMGPEALLDFASEPVQGGPNSLTVTQVFHTGHTVRFFQFWRETKGKIGRRRKERFGKGKNQAVWWSKLNNADCTGVFPFSDTARELMIPGK